MAKTVIEAEVKTNVGEVAKDMSFMGVSLNGLKAGFAKMAMVAKSSFATVKAGIISTGIGALVIAVISLFTYFTKTKRGAEMLERAMAGLGAVMNVVTDLFSAAGEILVKAFEDPQQAIKDLWEAIKTNLINRIEGMIDSFGALGKVIKSALSLDWEGMKEGAADFGESMVQTATGVDDLVGKMAKGFNDLGKEIENDTKAAMKLKGLIQQLRDEEREFSKVRAQTRQDIQKARLDALDESKTAEERLAALQKANELELKTTQDVLEMQKRKIKIQNETMDLSENMAEDLDELAALEVGLIDLQTQSFQTQKRLATEMETLTNEIKAAEKAAAKEISDKIKADEKARIVSQKLDLQAFTDWNLTRIKDETDEEFKIRIEATKKTAAAQKIIDTKAAADKKALDKLVVDTKLETEKMGFAAAKSIGGENAAIQQGIAVAETIYNTQQAMMKAMTLAPPYGQIQAALTGVMGAKAIQTILSTSPSSGSVGGGAVATATPDAQMMSGSFSLGQGQEVQPMQAYVVSDDITNNQNKLAIIRRRATI
tara:strand:- start:213 stop:1838 length:1626 start_codon:yes stop_codon:yes gene_type:complete